MDFDSASKHLELTTGGQTSPKTASLASNGPAAESLRTSFQRLASLIHDESRAPAPHICLSFAASSQIYVTVARLASSSHHEGIVREAVAVFGALIDSEEDDFLGSATFAKALMSFVGEVTNSGTVVVGIQTQGDIVELLFGIAAKIRLQPEMLPVWFTPSAHSELDVKPVVQKTDSQLIDHVHHEGSIGDFARTGLLYVFESASSSEDLEEWLVGSDLPTLMASGLGALYSQLSRKLSLLQPPAEKPLILSLSDESTVAPSPDAESFFSGVFLAHMDTFLSYLTFWQDVLEHCKSIDVKQTLVDHFQVLFLQQILYPSLLESSDVDGGSAVAVLTYPRRILESLGHPDLIHMILRYLLALPDPLISRPPLMPRSPTADRQRSSLLLSTEPVNENDKLNPALFNLVDFILNSAQSRNPQTVTAALRLASVILYKNHNYAVSTLVRVTKVLAEGPQRTVGALDAETEVYLSLAGALGGDDDLDEVYGNHLKDVSDLVESHPCSGRILTIDDAPIDSSRSGHIFKNGPGNVIAHFLSLDDPFLRSLLSLLETFLTNNIETNLALTEAFVNLASCAQVRLEGWLAVDPKKYKFIDSSDGDALPTKGTGLEMDQDGFESDEQEQLQRLYKARRKTSWSVQENPLVLGILQLLQRELDTIRVDVPSLDELVAARKNVLKLGEQVGEVLKSDALSIPLRSGRKPADAPSDPASAPTQKQPPSNMTPKSTPAKSPNGSRSRPSPTKPARGHRRGGSMTLHQPKGSPAPSILTHENSATSPTRSDFNARSFSPLSLTGITRGNVYRPPSSDADSLAEVLKRRIRVPARAGGLRGTSEDLSAGREGGAREVSLSHVLTNAVLLQEFVLEIVAVLQVRASLFEEVRFM
ncbi:hypothetical protein LTR04_004031 [Oleoguttula sp. CCFEE 6159]|nr:hypothetical protein LTR04_004031 [Oleoguttula sp. CCFEE 6159]